MTAPEMRRGIDTPRIAFCRRTMVLRCVLPSMESRPPIVVAARLFRPSFINHERPRSLRHIVSLLLAYQKVVAVLRHLADRVQGRCAKYTRAGPESLVANTVFDVCCTKETTPPVSLGSPASL